MRRNLEVQVEPLTEQRWSRVERAIFARLDAEASGRAPETPRTRSHAPLAWMSAAAAFAALALVIFWRAPTGAPRELGVSPSRISTGKNPSHLELPGVSLDVNPESAVVVGGEAQRSMLIVVDRGEIACDVAPRAADAPLIVQAGEVRVRVVGTRFKVSRLGESARVEVQKGVVEVSVAGKTTTVGAGESWASAKEVVSSAPEVTAPREPSVPSGAMLPDGVVVPEAHVRRAPPRGAVTQAHPVTPAPAPVVEEREAPAAPRARSSQDLFESAAKVEVSDPGRAITLYRSIETGQDSWAQNALFAHARLEATRGNKGEARRLLLQYLSRFPRGANADDARAVLERVR
ncbi:MAG TPA: FecR family protein [Polyangiaceae bacterium]|nr:FecR family protein [Polyangiaceae bacterium]